MNDPLEALLKECGTEMAQCEAHLANCADASRRCVSMTAAVMRAWTTESGTAWQSHRAAGRLNDAALPRAYDLELAVSERILGQEMAKSLPAPIEIDLGGQTLKLRPTAPPRFSLEAHNDITPPDDGFLVILPWKASGDLGNDFDLVLVLSCTLSTDSNSPVCNFMSACSVRLFDGQGHVFSLLRELPIEEARMVREQLFQESAKYLSAARIELVPPSAATLLGKGGFHGRRLRKALLLVSRTYAKRRRAQTLLRDPAPNEDVLVRLARDHILTRTQAIAAERSASVRSMVLHEGYADTLFFGRHREDFLHVAVITSVWLTYDLQFSSFGATLFADANLTFWRYEIKAKRCWPVCDDVIGLAEREVKKVIKDSSSISSLVADLSADFRRCTPVLDHTGLTLLLKRI